MTTKSRKVFSLAGFTLMGALAAPAQAEPPKHEECPSGGHLVSVKDAKEHERAKKLDKEGNHDGFVCERETSGKHHYYDNEKKKKDEPK